MFDRKLKNALVLLNVAVIVFVFFVILTSEQVEKTSTEVLPSEMVISPVEASIFDTGISSINVEQTEKPIEKSSSEAIVVPLEVPAPVTIEEPTPELTIGYFTHLGSEIAYKIKRVIGRLTVRAALYGCTNEIVGKIRRSRGMIHRRPFVCSPIKRRPPTISM